MAKDVVDETQLCDTEDEETQLEYQTIAEEIDSEEDTQINLSLRSSRRLSKKGIKRATSDTPRAQRGLLKLEGRKRLKVDHASRPWKSTRSSQAFQHIASEAIEYSEEY